MWIAWFQGSKQCCAESSQKGQHKPPRIEAQQGRPQQRRIHSLCLEPRSQSKCIKLASRTRQRRSNMAFGRPMSLPSLLANMHIVYLRGIEYEPSDLDGFGRFQHCSGHVHQGFCSSFGNAGRQYKMP